MKIAIIISGLPRCYKEGYEELKKWFLDKYDCDIYILGMILKQRLKQDTIFL